MGMAITLDLPPDLERKVQDQARASGQDAGQYIQRVLERTLSTPSLDEVLAPFRAEVERSGITDDELDELVEKARDNRFREMEGRPRRRDESRPTRARFM